MGETWMCERNINQLPLACSQPKTWTAHWACGPTGNQTNDLLVCGTMPKPLSHTNQGAQKVIFKVQLLFYWNCRIL